MLYCDYCKNQDDKNLIWTQSTGLEDKQGNLIFYGDIIHNERDQYYCIVSFCKDFGSNILLHLDNPDDDEYNFTLDLDKAEHSFIRGNIFENPELLLHKIFAYNG